MNIDDVRIVDAPACPNPSELTAFNITRDSAKLGWTKGYIETQWQVKVQLAGAGVPTEGDLTTNNTDYPVGTLQPNTTYEYYIRSYCSDAEQSEWIGPFVFTTLCEAFTSPFMETFNTDSVSEACWRVLNGNSDTNTWALDLTLSTYEGNQTAGVFTGSNGNNDDWLISPPITVTAGQRLRYYYRTYSPYFNEDIDVKLSTTGIEPENFTTTLYSADYFDNPPLNNEEWKEKVINLPEGVTGTINIAWHIPKKEPHWQGFRGQMFMLDKVIIEDIPACPIPSNLAVLNVADTTAELKWDANGTETQWDVYVQPEELDAPVGDGDAQYLHLADTNPYTVEGLTSAIKYEYYVRAKCDGTNKSEWLGPFEFTTMCSFENLCEYTITLTSAFYSGAGGTEINVMQNGFKLQTMDFPTAGWTEIPEPVTYNVLLCTGVEFSLYFDSVGTAPGQYPGCTIEVKNSEGTVVWTGDIGDLTPRSTIFTTVSTCGPITCPQPTDLAVSGTSVLSWIAGGTETEWEVAIQPVANNTLPQSGTIVNTNSYTPQDSDFANLENGSFEFFVRAICGDGDNSFWSGPFKFVRNDDASKAIRVPVNSGELCEESVTGASFIGATVSAEPMTCSGDNAGDVWFEFVAESKVHIVEISNFSAKDQYQAGNNADEVTPKVTLTLYKVNGSNLEEVTCTYNNVIVAAYSTELEVGATYKVRLTLNDTKPNACKFDVCVKTPDACKLDIVNGGFERPITDFGLGGMISQNNVSGWRQNIVNDGVIDEGMYIRVDVGFDGFMPYEEGQSIQLAGPYEQPLPDPNDLVNIRGMYQDLDSSEITKFAYSFAHIARGDDLTVQLYAGPPEGPFELLEERLGLMTWNFYEGVYNVPAGQNVTRFIFRGKDNSRHNVLDAVSITAVTKLITEAHTLDCTVNSTQLEAEGVGTWVADENNPSAVVITDPNSTTTTVTDFAKSGDYTFYWRTRYCEYSVVITKEAVDEVPAVTSPITYCVNEVAAQLSAPALDGLTVTWFTETQGGTGSTVAPTPVTTVDGTTSYYVAYVNAEGCEGARAEIQVVVNPKIVPVVEFTYDETEYCSMSTNPVISLGAGFETGGTFKVTPAGLTLDTVTGAIDLSTSALGTYEITYTIAPDGTVCNIGGTHSYTILVYEPLEVTIERECRENGLWLKVVSADSTFDPDAVDYVWKNENGATVGTNSSEFNVAEYYSQNGGLELPLYFTVTVGIGSCTSDADYTVTGVLCEVPRGISPNNDGKNDELDLTGFGVAEISIFNRYGKEVYSHGTGYTKQWHGQGSNGNELPDGTYYYSITKADGSNTTGWVYINRQH
ncbi:Fibronectin type III domain protein [compost metagenome]